MVAFVPRWFSAWPHRLALVLLLAASRLGAQEAPTAATSAAPRPRCRLVPADSLPAGTLVPGACFDRQARVRLRPSGPIRAGRLVAFDTLRLVLARPGWFHEERDTVATTAVAEVSVLAAQHGGGRMLSGAALGFLAGLAIGNASHPTHGCQDACDLEGQITTVGSALLGALGGLLVGSALPQREWRVVWRRPTEAPR